MKGGTNVEHEQGKQKPRSDAVRNTVRILPEVRQRRAFSAEDHRRRAAQHQRVLARLSRHAPGVDGVTFNWIEKEGLEEWLSGLRQELRTKTYRAVDYG